MAALLDKHSPQGRKEIKGGKRHVQIPKRNSIKRQGSNRPEGQ